MKGLSRWKILQPHSQPGPSHLDDLRLSPLPFTTHFAWLHSLIPQLCGDSAEVKIAFLAVSLPSRR